MSNKTLNHANYIAKPCLVVLVGIICGVQSKDYHIFDTIMIFFDSSIKHIIS